MVNIDLISFRPPIRNRKRLEKLYEQKKIFLTLTIGIDWSSITPFPLRSKYFHNGREEEEEEEYDTREIDTTAGIDKVRKDLTPSCIVHLSNEIVGYTHTCAFYVWVYDARLLAIVHGRLPVTRDVLLPRRWRLNPLREGEVAFILGE